MSRSKNSLTKAVSNWEDRHPDSAISLAQIPQCNHCRSFFSTEGALNSHISQRLDCRRFQKRRATVPAAPPLNLSGPPPDDVHMPARYDPFPSYVLPAQTSSSRSQTNLAGPSDSNQARQRVRRASGGAAHTTTNSAAGGPTNPTPSQHPPLDPDAEVVDEDDSAGRVYHVTKSKQADYERMLRTGSDNPFAPFVSELDWGMARWAKKTKTGDNSLTGLLDLPGVCSVESAVLRQLTINKQVVEKLGLSFKNARALNQIIDHELPETPNWTHTTLNMCGSDEQFDLFHRDVLACIRMLYGNPAFNKVMSYRPRKCYSDQRRGHRIYTELHTSDWWNNLQVSTTICFGSCINLMASTVGAARWLNNRPSPVCDR